MMARLCPKCKLPMSDNPALNARSHKEDKEICSECGMIEGYEAMGLSDRAYGLKVAQLRAQAAMYGLDEHGNPRLPTTE